ncbi:MAG: FGGY family carbohydrate kinase, partial [Thermoleophilia bacterium]
MTRRNAPLILALDQGTTSSRALLVDGGGRVVAVAQQEIAQSYPEPGLVEQDPLAMWRAQLDTAREVLARGSHRASNVAAIGIANQRETTIVWERATGAPLAPAIVWQDRRTAATCRALRDAGHEPRVARRTGLVLDPYFSATKLRWILEHVPDGPARARRGELAFGTVDSWLVWNLTGGRLHVTDATNASRTLLYDIHSGAWDDELLELFGVPRELLPAIVDTSAVVGETEPELLGEALPIGALCGDQQAALFGQGCEAPGQAKVTY